MFENCISPCCLPLSAAVSPYPMCSFLFLSSKIPGLFIDENWAENTDKLFLCPCLAGWLIQPWLIVNKNVHQTYADYGPWDRKSSYAHLETPSHHRADWCSPCYCSHSCLILVMYFMGQGWIRVQLIHWWPLMFSLHLGVVIFKKPWKKFFNRFWYTVYPYYYTYNYTQIQRLFTIPEEKWGFFLFFKLEKMWFFNTRCKVVICYTCTTGLNRETAAADKWSSTSTGVFNTRPLCWSSRLFISKRKNCLFTPRKIIWLYLCETVFTLRSYCCCGRAVRFTLHSPQCQRGRCHLIFINRLQILRLHPSK